jgi:hypothetical protein
VEPPRLRRGSPDEGGGPGADEFDPGGAGWNGSALRDGGRTDRSFSPLEPRGREITSFVTGSTTTNSLTTAPAGWMTVTDEGENAAQVGPM